MYTPLWVKSHYSFLEGASHPEELVEEAWRLGLPALAMTDRDGAHGLVRAHVKATEVGLKILNGAQLSVLDTLPVSPVKKSARAPRSTADPVDPRHPVSRLVVLARSREGYGQMCSWISRARLRCEKGRARTSLDEAREPRDGLLYLAPTPELLAPLREAHGDSVYALLARHRTPECVAREEALRREAKRTGVPIVGCNEVLYHSVARRPLQDVLTCIRQGVTLSTAGTFLRPNAEHGLLPPEAMRALFADDPAALARTRELADRCAFSLADIRYRYPGEQIPDGLGESDWLRELTMRGAAKRYDGRIPDDVRAQLDRELSLIAELEYGGYFLTMYEIVEFCRRSSILCQGRGSAANSAVCYCLGITAVDPVRMDLLFERFLSRERAEPPDIDLDIEHDRREEVIQWVYERYGRRHSAMVANVIRYRPRSAVRDVGKVLGLGAAQIDQLARLLGYHGSLEPTSLAQSGLDVEARSVQHLVRLTNEILEFPRHLSIHPGGFLLGHEPVDTLVPIEPATMEGRTVVQWDKYDVEALGLFKVDLLGLGALTVVHRCFELMRTHDGIELDMARVPAEDPETYDLVSRGDTVGVFQIESRAQMAMLPRLKPRTFYDLVIEVAIVRPGPIQGDMVHPYLRRREGLEHVEYPHASLERVLKKTLGVPIFQEQVMKLAVLAADYTPGEADKLRRDMAAWRSSGRIEEHHGRIVSRMVEKGITEEFAERVFSQIRGFGEYGFPESHAASFALIAYVTAWMRQHHPAMFTCALLDAQPMGFYAPATLVEDVRRRGVEVRPIAIGASEWNCSLEPGPRVGAGHWALRMGLRYVKGFGAREKRAFEDAPPPYTSLDDFVRRTRLGKRALLALAECGALEPLGVSRRDALWNLREVMTRLEDELSLAPVTQPTFAELGRHDQVLWDYRSSHHSTRGHPMERLRPALREAGVPSATQLARMRHGALTDYVGLVLVRQRPQTASGVVFGTMEDETGFVNLVMWADVFERYEAIAKTASLLGVTGKLQSQHGVTHLVAERLWDPRMSEEVAAVKSRDFH